MVFQIEVKKVNNTADFDSVVITLLIFGAYLYTYNMNPLVLTIILRVATIEKAMKQVRKI